MTLRRFVAVVLTVTLLGLDLTSYRRVCDVGRWTERSFDDDNDDDDDDELPASGGGSDAGIRGIDREWIAREAPVLKGWWFEGKRVWG